MKFPSVAQPTWLKEAVSQSIRTLQLVADGRMPSVIVGWMVVVACRRLLRCVYGTDEAAVSALTAWLMDEIELGRQL